MNRIERGIKDYVKGNRKTNQSAEIYDAIEVLSSMGDFEDFKKVMLGYKAGGTISGGGINLEKKAVTAQIDVEGFMDKMEELNGDANTEDGWTEVLNSEKGCSYVRKTDSGDTLMRSTFKMNLTAEHAVECFMNTS